MLSYNSPKEISMFSAPHRQLNRLCLTAILALALPALGISSTVTGIEANGACEAGTCTASGLASGALTPGGSTSGNYNFDVSFLDGDVYDVSGAFNNSFPSGTLYGFFPTVTLTSGAAAGTDTITLDMLQDFFASGALNWDSTYRETIPFDLSADMSASGQLQISTQDDSTLQSVGLLSATGPGDTVQKDSKFLTGLNGDTLVTDYRLRFTFDKGAPNGSSGGSPIPEPSQMTSLGLVLAGLIVFRVRKLRSGARG
jgi:hypothetical protein